MRKELTSYFRCPDESINFQLAQGLSGQPGFFAFGLDAICYGRSTVGTRSKQVHDNLYDTLNDVRYQQSSVVLPFDPEEIADNLHNERYLHADSNPLKLKIDEAIRKLYYLARPMMPVAIRRHLQKARLNGWKERNFPRWPVDTSMDALMERLLSIAIKSNGGQSVPFIWFWPEGMRACAIMTHDVEAGPGVEYCSRLMDFNQTFDVPASFQVIPEHRYEVKQSYLDSIRNRGFEVCVHDLNHDGRLYWDREEFRRRAEKINEYGEKWGATGFRSAILYRNQDWYGDLNFEFDMSVPNVAHLDPQHGGCCTVMPFFIGKMVELPVTATQDYSLFNILKDYSLSLWEEQIEIILQKHGLINMIVHPDYLVGPQEENLYQGLLAIFARIRCEQNVWTPLPKDANTWWRQRSQMRVVNRSGEWQIEGEGRERAVLAFASLEGERLTYSLMHPPGRVTKHNATECVNTHTTVA